jgi:hypothetical protein
MNPTTTRVIDYTTHRRDVRHDILPCERCGKMGRHTVLETVVLPDSTDNSRIRVVHREQRTTPHEHGNLTPPIEEIEVLQSCEYWEDEV